MATTSVISTGGFLSRATTISTTASFSIGGALYVTGGPGAGKYPVPFQLRNIGSNTTLVEIYQNGDIDTLQLFYRNSGGAGQDIQLGTSSLYGQWIHWAFTMNGGTKAANFYAVVSGGSLVSPTYLITPSRGNVATLSCDQLNVYVENTDTSTLATTMRQAGFWIAQAELSEAQVLAKFAQEAPTSPITAVTHSFLELSSATTPEADTGSTASNFTKNTTNGNFSAVSSLPSEWSAAGPVDVTPPLLTSASTLLLPTVSQAGAPAPVLPRLSRARVAPIVDTAPRKLSARALLPLWSVDMPPGIGWGTYPDATPAATAPRKLRAAPSLLLAAASVNVQPPLLTSAATTLAPTVATSLSAPLLTSAASLLAPSVATALSAPLLTATSTTLTPSVATGLAAPLLTSAATVQAPALTVSLSAPLLTSAASLLLPVVDQVGTTNVQPPLLSSAATLLAPSLTVAIAAPVLTSAATPLAPTVAKSLAAPLLSATSSVLAPSVATALQAPSLTATATTLAPAMSVALQAPLLTSSATLLLPVVDQVGSTLVQPPLLTASSSTLAPAVAKTLAPPLLTSSATLLLPQVDQAGAVNVQPPLLTSAATVLPPSVSVSLQLAILSAAPTLLVPQVDQAGAVQVQPPLLTSAATVLPPRVDRALAVPLFTSAALVIPPYSVDGSTPPAAVGGSDVVLWDGLGPVALDSMRVRGTRGR